MKVNTQTKNKSNAGSPATASIQTPSITLPKGGGAIRSIDEKFTVNAVNGTLAMNVPLPFSSARGYGPSLSLSYNSGSGNSSFGLGWQLNLPSIKRRVSKEVPRYDNETDVFLIGGAEDLVPVFKKDPSGNFIRNEEGQYVPDEFLSADGTHLVRRYRPRVEGLFARIERWMEKSSGLIHWQVISKDNVTTIYGRSEGSRVADPKQPLQIFEWLIDLSYDDKGNCSVYEYRKEDGTGMPRQLHNSNRFNGNAPFTHIYLKKVRYGNTVMYKHGDPVPVQFMFETVFDYGEHAGSAPCNEEKTWHFRSDAFSEYRAGFEIRNCRLCRRVLLYHYFNELPGGSALVKAVQLHYGNNGADGFTFLQSVVTTGYTKHDDGAYTEKSLPPVSFEYSKHTWNEKVMELPAANLVHAPVGINEPLYHFVDLYNEGLSGILTDQADGWFYKHNQGNGRFTEAQMIAAKPNLKGLGKGKISIRELEANGIKQLVSWEDGVSGFFEIQESGNWGPFESFEQIPNVDLNDRNCRLIDLDGDGQADLLITEDNAFTWYPSLGKKGFGRASKTFKALDEEKGPAIVFADNGQTIFLAGMTGSGLTDIVRIRNGEVCYWPNLGYGRFGARVSMDNAPVFDQPDLFNSALIRLADIDGSGTPDIIYLGQKGITIWFNQQGNRFATAPKRIIAVPERAKPVNWQVADLLGTGLSCLVCNSPLPQHQAAPLRYIDLMNSEKPHVLTGYKNNLGKEVTISYKPSTHYYIEDKLAGEAWVTRLHFPVHCVSKVVTYDRIMKTRFATEYSYHHGYYDHKEKEFRGFGRVEEKDSEDIMHFMQESNQAANNVVDAALHQHPVLTKTWYHTGAFLNQEKILGQYAHEYYQNTLVPEKQLPQPVLPATWNTNEWQEALRACKGTMLRKEIYALDGSAQQTHPYSVEEHALSIHCLQPGAQQPYAVWLVHERESITYQYERNPADARVMQNFTLKVNDYGQVEQTVSIAYKRQFHAGNEPEQEKLYCSYQINSYTNSVHAAFDYRVSMPWQQRTYEVNGLPVFTGYLSWENIKTYVSMASDVPYERSFNGTLQRKLIEYTRTRYRGDDGSAVLPFGQLLSKALVHQSYTAIGTPAMMNKKLGDKIPAEELDPLLLDATRGGYQYMSGYYWMPSGTSVYDPANFYAITAVTDVFGNTGTVEYDASYRLFVIRTTDALGNTVRIKELPGNRLAFNYRTLSPYIMQDMNDNETAVRFDELGLTVQSFIIGKKGIDACDELDESKTELKGAQDQPTSVITYSTHDWYLQSGAPDFDINNYKPQPAWVKVRSRETHYHAHVTHITRWHESYSYSDGGGHEILKKSQAEPGLALQVQPDGNVITVDTGTALRWIGNGRTLLNNKGNAVKQYEPYFSASAAFDDEEDMVQLGVTPVLEYDALNRLIKTTNADNTITKVVFTPWMEMQYDANDTVLDSEWYVERGSPNPLGPEPADAAMRAAWLSAKHANTPSIKHLDTLGRSFLTTADNNGELLNTRVVLDMEGNELVVQDALRRTVVTYEYDMRGNILMQTGMDAGRRWMLADAANKPLVSFDDRGHRFGYRYDALLRPVASLVQEGSSVPVLYEKLEYGESMPIAAAKAANLLGKVRVQYDQSGCIYYKANDCKGNAIHTGKRFAVDYKTTIDWTHAETVALQDAEYESRTQFDAMNRPVTITTPHSATMLPSEIYPAYNEANLLTSIAVKLRGASDPAFFVNAIHYDAKGQRTDILYGNQTRTQYTYDNRTYRLLQQCTTRNAGTGVLQDMHYVYDAAGNVVQLNDAAQGDVFFDGEQVAALNKYEYDAVYRLIKASGRKHAGQTDIDHNRPDNNYRNHPFIHSTVIDPNNANAFRNYREEYTYDKSGNMLLQQHTAKNSSFTRAFNYQAGSNRLAATQVGSFQYKYIDELNGINYDANGNMPVMEQVQSLLWNFKDELQETSLGGGGKAWYVYGNDKQRVRKIIERPGGIIEERYYLGIMEIYRKTAGGGTVVLERETLHVMDNQNRVAMLDTPVVLPAGSQEQEVMRYQYANHLRSAGMELDDLGNIISREEYFPYGTTSFSTTDASREVTAARYRYTGKERDEETGLYYHGARYYAPWLCRWASADPVGISGGINLYEYAGGNPVSYNDPGGTTPYHMSPTHPLMVDQFLKPDAAPPRLNDLERYSVTPFWNKRDASERWNQNLNMRTVYKSTSGAHLVDVPSQFNSSGSFLGTGDTAFPMHVDEKLRGNNISLSIRQTHFKQYYEKTGQRPTSFSVTVVHDRTVAQLEAGMPVEQTDIGKHIARSARPLGLRVTSASGSHENMKIEGTFSYQPIRARIDGAVEGAKSMGKAIVSKARSAGTAIKNAAAPGAAVGTGIGMAARAAMVGKTAIAGVARAAIPGVAEAMDARAFVRSAGGMRVVAQSAVQPLAQTARTVAAGVAGAPAVAAGTAVAAGVAGGVVGDFVEPHVTAATGSRTAGVASATLAGAATGALIGAAIGSVVPVLGTAAGAVIGGTAGAIGGFIGGYF